MAAEAEEVVSEKAQNYLDKHRISSLFEDLKSKIVKDLPLDPIEFLISKLQALKQRKKGAGPRPATFSGIPSSKTGIQVTGSSVPTSSKLSSPSTAKIRPGLASAGSSSSKKTQTRPTSTANKTGKSAVGTKLKPPASISSPRRPTTAPAAGKSSINKSSTLKSPSKLSSSSSGTKTTPSKTPVRTTPSKTPVRGGLKEPAISVSKTGTGTGKKAAPTRTSKDKAKSPQKTPPCAPATKTASKQTSVNTKASENELADFFGEPKKTSLKSAACYHDNVDNLSAPSVGGEESDSEGGARSEGGEVCDCGEVSLEALLQRKMSMKQSKSKRSPKNTKSHLSLEEDLSTTPPSLGYHSGSGEGCEESEDECVEAVEDVAALEDEGVTRTASSKLSSDMKVDFMVLLCARCAKMLTGDEPIAEVNAIVVTKGAASDFESASQVGSHASFPQWEGGTEVDSEMSSVDKWKTSSDTSTNITLVSRDTWGGLAPKARPSAPLVSDTDSEVQLPLEGRPWREESTYPHDPHGWGGQS